MNTPQTSDVIKLLPDSVANQIAAGEVIQRPASVIKELVENAIDAGGTVVDIVIKDAGKTLIQVIDNGCGMSPTDARMAFERHATSKIRKADDLFTLHTMGFRGEALPSVAAVSEIDLRTMRESDSLGTRLVIKASKVEKQEPEVCVRGTNIMVKNLFYNFVARRRFLKKDSIELSHIMHEFERLALVNTDVEFSLSHNGTIVHKLPRGPMKQRIGALFGRSVEKQLIPIDTRTATVHIHGFIGLPANARQRNQLQYFFVNGRNMRHPYFHRAVMNCYKDLISGDAQPNYFIHFEVEPDRIDVNIHPQKHEIKFEDEQMIWQVLTAAVKESLGKFNVGPAIDFDAVDVPDIPPLQQGATSADLPTDAFDPEYNPFELTAPPVHPAEQSLFEPRAGMNVRRERPSALNNGDWTKLYDSFINTAAKKETARSEEPSLIPDATPAETPATDQPMFQLKNRWIVTSTRGGLMLVDQHRAHLRILYDRLLPAVEKGSMSSQRLIFSEETELDAASHAILLSVLPLLTDLGFDLTNTQHMTWAINAVPAELASTAPCQALVSIISDLAETGADPNDDRRSRIALSMARAAAIRNNQPLSLAEMQQLLSDLLRLPSSNFTPDGYPVIHIITPEQLATFFHK